MRGNSFGKMISITSFGESHGPAIGAIVDGVPAGLDFSLNELQKYLDRRAPGKIPGTTNRKEPDKAIVLSGIFEGKTLGTPIAVIVENKNQKSSDYDKLKNEFRPGHADKTTLTKFGIRDHRGGGRSSGRETISRVIGGYFASLIIPNIQIKAFASKIGKYIYPESDSLEVTEKYLEQLKKDGESVGGEISITVENCPAGLGEPAFDKLKSDMAHALMSIGGCVSFSYGLGEKFAEALGKDISKDISNFGGIEGGISNGEKISMRITFKPTSTIGDKARAGRHDPCIIPRAIPVVESMVKLVVADHYLRQNAYQL